MTALRHERGAAMVARTHAEAGALIGQDGAHLVRDAMIAALRQREQFIDDDHDPRYLHPGRTVRILIADAQLAHAPALAAAALIDSVDAHLAPPADAAGADAAAIVAAMPQVQTDADDVLERLITAETNVALVALAERLDHARHLHLRPDLEPVWADFHRSIRADYVPAARRLNTLLAKRFEHWADAFERRLLMPGR